jgi:hypothetical protein
MSNPNQSLLWFLLTCALGCNICYSEEKSATEIDSLSNDELQAAIEETEQGPLDRHLLEVIKRGGPRWTLFLKSRLKGLETRTPRGGATRSNLGTLTALRRMQGMPDPLAVLVVGHGPVSCKNGRLPTLNVLLVNLDREKTPFDVQLGGDDRSGRKARWRVEVVNVEGTTMPIVAEAGPIRGGLSSWGALKYGESWRAELPLGDYIAPLPPGTYTARVLYHNEEEIAGRGNCDNMIIYKSEPFTLNVRD